MEASVPVKITYRNIKPADAVDEEIRERAARLEKFCPTLMAINVLLETPHRSHHKGDPHRVRIEMKVPGNDLVVSRHHGEQHAHADLHVVLRDTFKAARRELETYTQRRRNQVKHHERN